MLSDSEADYNAHDNLSERAHSKLLLPNFPFFRWYATFMLFTLLIFVFYVPVRVAFFPGERWVHHPCIYIYRGRRTRKGCFLELRESSRTKAASWLTVASVANHRSEKRVGNSSNEPRPIAATISLLLCCELREAMLLCMFTSLRA